MLELNLRQLIRHCQKRADVSGDFMGVTAVKRNQILSGIDLLQTRHAMLLADYLGVELEQVVYSAELSQAQSCARARLRNEEMNG